MDLVNVKLRIASRYYDGYKYGSNHVLALAMPRIRLETGVKITPSKGVTVEQRWTELTLSAYKSSPLANKLDGVKLDVTGAA